MAGFKTHITTSTVLGVGYGAGAYFGFQYPWETCVLAGGLCGVSGMFPDLDSGPGIPLRESMAFAAAVVPMLLIDRFARAGMSVEMMVLAGGLIYFGIRFGLAELMRRYTVHRGMFHSIPALIIAGEVAFLVCSGTDLMLRCVHTGGVLLGFGSHLLLDEVWSIEFSKLRLKKSFGTAIKIWGDSMWANFSTYAKLIILTYLVMQDPVWEGQFDTPAGENIERIAHDVMERFRR